MNLSLDDKSPLVDERQDSNPHYYSMYLCDKLVSVGVGPNTYVASWIGGLCSPGRCFAGQPGPSVLRALWISAVCSPQGQHLTTSTWCTSSTAAANNNNNNSSTSSGSICQFSSVISSRTWALRAATWRWHSAGSVVGRVGRPRRRGHQDTASAHTHNHALHGYTHFIAALSRGGALFEEHWLNLDASIVTNTLLHSE